MTLPKVCLGTFFALAAVLTVQRAEAAELQIGQKAPDWSGVIGIDDQKHSLADYKDAKLIALVFTCNHCPVAQAYQDRIMAIQRDYRGKGVQVVAVNVNNIPEDRLDKMKERAKDKGFNFPYLYDPTQKIAHDYGATVTPHVFLLDQDRSLVYRGAIDDKMNVDLKKEDSLRDALDAVLAGRKPAKATTKEFGCTIKYETKNDKKNEKKSE